MWVDRSAACCDAAITACSHHHPAIITRPRSKKTFVLSEAPNCQKQERKGCLQLCVSSLKLAVSLQQGLVGVFDRLGWLCLAVLLVGGMRGAWRDVVVGVVRVVSWTHEIRHVLLFSVLHAMKDVWWVARSRQRALKSLLATELDSIVNR